MDEKLLLKAVVLAGEIMLSSGAEVSRVENTMQFMLRRSNCEVTEAVVLATGLFVTMADPGGEPMTFSKRIPARSTNINRICRVNEVSRQFCHMELTVEEAYEELKRIQKEILYKPWMEACRDHRYIRQLYLYLRRELPGSFHVGPGGDLYGGGGPVHKDPPAQ